MTGQPDAESPHEAFYFFYMAQLQAVRAGKWKLYLPGARETVGKKGKGKLPLLLFDLSQDISERTNVADLHPDVVRRLEALLQEHNREVRQNRRPVGQFKPEKKSEASSS